MTKEDRNLIRAMFLIIFWMIWSTVAEIKGMEVPAENWNDLYTKAITISKKEE